MRITLYSRGVSSIDKFFQAIDVDSNQQAQIADLRRQMLDAHVDFAPAPVVRDLLARTDKLELVSRALVDLLLTKGLLTETELEVMMQQVDLLDGVEDGKLSPTIKQGAPTCSACGKFLNPRRPACIYCGTVPTEEIKAAPPPPKTVSCAACTKVVPQQATYYSSRGVICESCFMVLED